jgi:hypothetical protein
MISIPRIYVRFISNRPKLLWALLIIPIVIGLATYHFVGGQASAIGGRIQAAGVIIILHYVLSLYLYRDYSNRNIQRIMASWPVIVIRAIIFSVLSFISIYMLYLIYVQSS